MFSGGALFVAAGLIGYQSILEIRTPHHSPAWFTLPVVIGVIAVKELLSRRVFAAADTFDSNALKGDAWHHRSEAITSAAAAVGITIALIGGKGWEMADDWGALAACSVILTNAFRIVKSSVYDATDRAVSPQLRDSIRVAAENQPGVQRIEKCLVRKNGTQLFVELHVEVDPSMTIRKGHRVGHQVKAALMTGNPRIRMWLYILSPRISVDGVPAKSSQRVCRTREADRPRQTFAARVHLRIEDCDGGIGHTLPYLIPEFRTATAIAVVIVAIELLAISWIRKRYMDTPFLRAAFQVIVRGVLVFLVGIWIGSS